MKTLIALLFLASTGFLTSCLIPEANHSVPDYFLLTSRVGESNNSTQSDPVSFYVKEVRLPHYLQDKRLVSRPTDDTIFFRENQRWGEPLEMGISRVLGQNLSFLLNTFDYGVYPQRRKFEYSSEIEVTIERFEMISGNLVKVKAFWEVNKKGGRKQRSIFEQTYSITDSNVKGEVRALSELLFKMSSDIARKF
jgi:uncharacterized lipoprotein YmbA